MWVRFLPGARAISSVGRAALLHSEGHRFESCIAHRIMSLNKDIVLYSILGILGIGMLYMFYSNYQLQRALMPEVGGPGDPALQGIEVGNKSVLNSPQVGGSAKTVSKNSFTMQTETGTLTINVSPGIPVVKVGRTKTEAEINADLALYNAEVNELMQDPQRNKEALARIAVPSMSVETPIALSAIRAGAQVSAAVAEAEGPTRTALKVYIF